jgi:2,4-dienoyl-CoA reductase-like NADH-dependent reductase (Old Yellow Enzyme family)
VGRSLLADGQWVRKVREGRFDEIRKFERSHLRKASDWDNARLMEAHELSTKVSR